MIADFVCSFVFSSVLQKANFLTWELRPMGISQSTTMIFFLHHTRTSVRNHQRQRKEAFFSTDVKKKSIADRRCIDPNWRQLLFVLFSLCKTGGKYIVLIQFHLSIFPKVFFQSNFLLKSLYSLLFLYSFI